MSTIWRTLLVAWLGGTSAPLLSLDQAALARDDTMVTCESEQQAEDGVDVVARATGGRAQRQSCAHSSADAPVIARTRSSSAASSDAAPE
jgi:hypothetical protein